MRIDVADINTLTKRKLTLAQELALRKLKLEEDKIALAREALQSEREDQFLLSLAPSLRDSLCGKTSTCVQKHRFGASTRSYKRDERVCCSEEVCQFSNFKRFSATVHDSLIMPVPWGKYSHYIYYSVTR